MKNLIFIWACLFLSVPCIADTFTVDPNGSADFTNIQDAIDYAWHGDAIIVRPGTYNESVYSNGGTITLTSTDPNDANIVATTTITGGVTFAFYEQSDTVITGFTITTETGGSYAIECIGASPTISRNIITNCSTGISGSGPAAPILSNCTISGCEWGINNCHGTIVDNIITHNLEYGLISCDGTITGNIISGNGSSSPGGGLSRCDGTISDNIISDNTATESGGGGLSRCNGEAIVGNTIVGNMANLDGGGALYICDTITKNNIIAFNRIIDPYTGATGGIFGHCQNSYNAFWDNLPGDLVVCQDCQCK